MCKDFSGGTNRHSAPRRLLILSTSDPDFRLSEVQILSPEEVEAASTSCKFRNHIQNICWRTVTVRWSVAGVLICAIFSVVRD